VKSLSFLAFIIGATKWPVNTWDSCQRKASDEGIDPFPKSDASNRRSLSLEYLFLI